MKNIKISNLYKNILILVLFLCFGGIMSLVMRLWPDFDFYSYHYQNGWAFLNNRTGIDFMPSTFRSYFNPLLDAGTFALMRFFNNNSGIFMFVSGFKYGLFLFLSYLIFGIFFKNTSVNRNILIVFCLFLSFLSPMLILTLGYDWTDIQTACCVLVSVYLYFSNIFESETKKRNVLIFISAVVLGGAVGLKYTACVYVFAVLICTFAGIKSIEKPAKTLMILCFGIFVGFLITDGLWLYLVYKHFGNPMFPYFNNIFSSPYGTQSLVLDYDFAHIRPKSFFALLFYPLANTAKGNVGAEYGFWDLKLPLTFILTSIFLLFLPKIAKIKTSLNSITEPKIFYSSLIFLISAYYLNAYIFGQARYITVLIPFSCIVITVILYIFSDFIKNRLINFYFVSFLIVLFMCGYLIFARFLHIDFLVLSLFITVSAFIYLVYYSKSFSNPQKNFYIVLALILLFWIATTKLPVGNVSDNMKFKDKVVMADKYKIEDNSVVLCATMTACAIAPELNKNAKYISYALQEGYKMEKFYMKKQNDLSCIEYTSPYLYGLMKSIFEQEKNIYMVFGRQDIDYGEKKILELYRKSLFEYTDGKMDLSNCSIFNQAMFPNSLNEYIICKLK